MRRLGLLMLSHAIVLAGGVALGIYLLPILTAPSSPDARMLQDMAQDARYTARFTRDLRGSDFLHWGEGTVSLTPTRVVHEGRLAPGPDYKMYLVPRFVDHEDAFLPVKDQSLQVGDVKSFNGVIVDLPAGVDLDAYTTVLIWCEAFGEFITAAEYR